MILILRLTPIDIIKYVTIFIFSLFIKIQYFTRFTRILVVNIKINSIFMYSVLFGPTMIKHIGHLIVFKSVCLLSFVIQIHIGTIYFHKYAIIIQNIIFDLILVFYFRKCFLDVTKVTFAKFSVFLESSL